MSEISAAEPCNRLCGRERLSGIQVNVDRGMQHAARLTILVQIFMGHRTAVARNYCGTQEIEHKGLRKAKDSESEIVRQTISGSAPPISPCPTPGVQAFSLSLQGFLPVYAHALAYHTLYFLLGFHHSHLRINRQL